jgi:hypothetical protein
MHKEQIFVLNDIEKQIAGELIQKLSAGDIPPKSRNNESLAMQQLSYEYYTVKQEKIVRGIMPGGVSYKLRYKDSNRIFFSAWDCKDACGIFYNMMAVIYGMTKQDIHIFELYRPFDVDVHTGTYVFLTGDIAAAFVRMADHLCKEEVHKVSYSSQYILSVFDHTDECKYDALIQQLKTEGSAKIQILQAWIRGEILYYTIVDGAVMRPPNQRLLSSKEEEDLIRKIDKVVNNRFRSVDLNVFA